ncbi:MULTISPECIES: ATP-NAD kinase family protein [Rhizobium]|uniref:Putative polyphosphate/ATP-dependent NAD kinase n=1 Tax=Rhizobium esperanzae TaxID=1967781 RepID=A0A7W6UKT3_9HYPH|nr:MULTISPECIES: NAD(+)/NADH kinase [Rhizobium]MBB4439931.1 putative polyphosphate/ATP-dependent NAD kinase [Rhizobium esperanzae]MDH6202502.1 putative polyphosphate/ATP-dependent NAD kinase [Rhizobium leguminosarum]
MARQIAKGMRDGQVYILGPGTTTRRVAEALGIKTTLLGVDALLDREVIGLDLDEKTLLSIIEGRRAEIVFSVLGGQGSLFGRGNQQISAEVIRRVGRDNIKIISTAEKLINLPSGALQVDTGDAEIDAIMAGYIPVITAPGRTMLVKVRA